MRYIADFTYTEPRFGDIEIETQAASTVEEAEEIALEQIKTSYPEALDVEIIGMRELVN